MYSEIDECQEYGSAHCQQSCKDAKPGRPFECSCDPHYNLSSNYADCVLWFVPDTTEVIFIVNLV